VSLALAVLVLVFGTLVFLATAVLTRVLVESLRDRKRTGRRGGYPRGETVPNLAAR
jgi:hypothetical protein